MYVRVFSLLYFSNLPSSGVDNLNCCDVVLWWSTFFLFLSKHSFVLFILDNIWVVFFSNQHGWILSSYRDWKTSNQSSNTAGTSDSRPGLWPSFDADGGDGRTGTETGVSWSAGVPGFTSDEPGSSSGSNMASSLGRVVGCNLIRAENTVSVRLCGCACADVFGYIWMIYSIVDPVSSLVASLTNSASPSPLSISISSSPCVTPSLGTSRSPV